MKVSSFFCANRYSILVSSINKVKDGCQPHYDEIPGYLTQLFGEDYMEDIEAFDHSEAFYTEPTIQCVGIPTGKTKKTSKNNNNLVQTTLRFAGSVRDSSSQHELIETQHAHNDVEDIAQPESQLVEQVKTPQPESQLVEQVKTPQPESQLVEPEEKVQEPNQHEHAEGLHVSKEHEEVAQRESQLVEQVISLEEEVLQPESQLVEPEEKVQEPNQHEHEPAEGLHVSKDHEEVPQPGDQHDEDDFGEYDQLARFVNRIASFVPIDKKTSQPIDKSPASSESLQISPSRHDESNASSSMAVTLAESMPVESVESPLDGATEEQLKYIMCISSDTLDGILGSQVDGECQYVLQFKNKKLIGQHVYFRIGGQYRTTRRVVAMATVTSIDMATSASELRALLFDKFSDEHRKKMWMKSFDNHCEKVWVWHFSNVVRLTKTFMPENFTFKGNMQLFAPSSLVTTEQQMDVSMCLGSTAEYFIGRLSSDDKQLLQEAMLKLDGSVIRVGTSCSGTDICVPVVVKTLEVLSKMFKAAQRQ